MKPVETQLDKQKYWDYAITLPRKENPMNKFTVRGSQFEPTYFEFSGACAGCGETPYVHLVTSLFGDRMLIANATGCSSIYGASAPSMPYCTNTEGQGPAWANSLFEDNAEFGLGMHLGEIKLRRRVEKKLNEALPSSDENTKAVIKEWIAGKDAGDGTRNRAEKLETALKAEISSHPEYEEILALKDHFIKRASGYLAATAGLTISVSAVWITSLRPEKTSTFSYWIRKFIPIRAASPRNPLPPQPSLNLRQPAKRQRKKTSA